MRAILYRHSSSPFGVFGYLDLIADDGKKLGRFCIGEDDWLNNKPNKSCIPSGQYTCKAVQSPKFGATYEVTKVPGRSHILFHAGNTEEDTEGCLLVGNAYGALSRQDEDGGGVMTKWAVVDSKRAFQRFRDVLGATPSFPLEIRWDFNGWR